MIEPFSGLMKLVLQVLLYLFTEVSGLGTARGGGVEKFPPWDPGECLIAG